MAQVGFFENVLHGTAHSVPAGFCVKPMHLSPVNIKKHDGNIIGQLQLLTPLPGRQISSARDHNICRVV